MQRLFARFQATCVSVQTQAAVVEAASLEAASEEAASEEAATEEDTASEVEEAAVEEAEPPQAVMPAARARATTATATFLSFISMISLFLKNISTEGLVYGACLQSNILVFFTKKSRGF